MRHRILGKRLILAYHGIVPEGKRPAGERALFVPQTDFAAQLDVLAAFADMAPLGRIDEAGAGRPRVAIPFDDGYRARFVKGCRNLLNMVYLPPSSSCRDASTVTSLRAEFGEKAVAWFAYLHGLNRPAVHRAVAGVS